MPDQFCAHGVPFSSDCAKCKAERLGRAMIGTAVKPVPEPGSIEDIHPHRDHGYPEKECSVCLTKFRGPFQTCSRTCARQKYG